jgi:Fe-Mn family superoxide dismutase
MEAKFELPELPYEYDSLEPYIDEETMKIHHDKHHAGYVAKLNAAVEGVDLESENIGEVLSDLNALPEDKRKAIVNNGGGHFNHTLFWEILGKDKQEPSDKLQLAIDETFGSMHSFKEKFNEAAKTQFGSGWAWLVVDSEGKLEVMSTANQDSPISQGKKPILNLDVWEHAYYLKYQNKRPDYVEAFWSVVNWEAVSEKYEAALE